MVFDQNFTKDISQTDKIGFTVAKDNVDCKISKVELTQMIF